MAFFPLGGNIFLIQIQMNRFIIFRFIISIILILLGPVVIGQTSTSGQEVRYNPISTAVPFLTITPDSRHGAMGDVGAATSPDANSQYLNPSKYAFTEAKYGLSLSYTPWLRELVNDNSLAYLSGYYRIDNNQVIGSSLRYLIMGAVTMTGADQSVIGTGHPNEFAIDFSYSRKLSENFSGGVALRYIRSDINDGLGSVNYTAGNAFATDVSFYYINKWGSDGASKSLSFGIDLSNIGSKISYDQGTNKEFLPANMRIGSTYSTDLDDLNSISFSLDLNKLLVPTPTTQQYRENNGNVVTLPDYNTNKPVISSIFSSFSDAPGGLKEELQEVTVSTGAEYWYNKKFALRAGYFNEARNKGNRKFFSAGVGVKMNRATIDLSYLVPTHRNTPLSNTIRFSLLFDVDSFAKKKESEKQLTSN